MPSKELIIEALTCLIKSQKEEIKDLSGKIEEERNTTMFLLNIVEKAESREELVKAILSNKAGNYSLSDKEFDDIKGYFESAGL